MLTKNNSLSRAGRALALAVAVIASYTGTHAQAGDADYRWTRTELKSQSDLVLEHLKALPAEVTAAMQSATAVLVCPGVATASASKSECLLEERGQWRAYYQLELPDAIWKAEKKAPQAVVYVLHTSKAFTQLLGATSWPVSNVQTLSKTDISVLVLTPEQVHVAPSWNGVVLKRIFM